VRVALAPLYGRVLVDLTRCSFIDSTAIATLIEKARALARDVTLSSLRVSADPFSHVARTLAIVGMSTFMLVHVAPPSATPDC
jgi:anti-anti-sigma regulatory factor